MSILRSLGAAALAAAFAVFAASPADAKEISKKRPVAKAVAKAKANKPIAKAAAKAKAKAKKTRAGVVKGPSVSTETPWRRTPYVGAIAAVAEEGGKVLLADRADTPARPASVTKLMTLLLVLEDVQAQKYTLDDLVEATADVNRCEPSWIGLKVGDKVSVRDLCYALMVESANDSAIALGVHSAGSFGGFVARMNARAQELGMTKTTYYNPNGLPPNPLKRYPWTSFNVTTASDQLKLARRLVQIPEVFAFTSVKTCDLIKTATGYRVSVTRQTNKPVATTTLAEGEKLVKQFRNHNNVMRTDKLKIFNPDGTEAIDGLKTGYIDAGGSSIVLTGTRKGKRVIVVVLGSATAKLRDANARKLMEDALGAVGI